MAGSTIGFLRNARSLARNPLGIVALFIALIYGFATLLLGATAGTLEAAERQPLLWFVVLFPILVLVCFYLLVTRHHGKLYAPDDYRDDQSFLQTLTALQRDVRLDEEIEAAEATTDVQQASLGASEGTPGPSATTVRFEELRDRRAHYRLAERLALRKITNETGLTFKEQVSFGGGRMGAFDAVATDGDAFLAVEVKVARGRGMPLLMIREILYRGVLAANLLAQKPGQKRLRLLLAFVLDEQALEWREQLERMVKRQVADAPLPVDLRFYELPALKEEFGESDA